MARQHYGGGTNRCRVWYINRSKTRLKSKGNEGHALPVTCAKERDSSSLLNPITATSNSTIPPGSNSNFRRLNWDDNLCRLVVLQVGPSFSSQEDISKFSDNDDDDGGIPLAAGKDEKMKQQEQQEHTSSANTRSFYGKTTSSAVALFEMTPPASTAPHRHQRRQSFCKWLDSINKCSSHKTKEQSQEHKGIVIQESSKRSVKRKLQLLNSQGDSKLKKSSNSLTKILKETSCVEVVAQNNDSGDFKAAIGLVKQPSSHTSLSLAKAYFDYLDKTNLQTVAVDDEETTTDFSTSNRDAPANNNITMKETIPSTRTRRAINYQCPTLTNEYRAYHDSALSCGIEPLSIREFACQRWKYFHREGFFDGFFDE
jgi:hypothetical protein